MEMMNEIPMNLQFFAEDAPETSVEETNDAPRAETKEETVEEPNDEKSLSEQLQSALVELAKVKRAQEKAASEASEYKKKWKDSLSEKEVIDMEKAEAQAKREEEYENLKRTVRINELTENFMDLGYGKDLAKKAASAQADGDTDTLLEIQKAFQENQRKIWEADFIKSRPEIRAGVGGTQSITKEQFDNMSLIERSKLRRENEAEYNRLIAL